jgi:hypothetical protein
MYYISQSEIIFLVFRHIVTTQRMFKVNVVYLNEMYNVLGLYVVHKLLRYFGQTFTFGLGTV